MANFKLVVVVRELPESGVAVVCEHLMIPLDVFGRSGSLTRRRPRKGFAWGKLACCAACAPGFRAIAEAVALASQGSKKPRNTSKA